MGSQGLHEITLLDSQPAPVDVAARDELRGLLDSVLPHFRPTARGYVRERSHWLAECLFVDHASPDSGVELEAFVLPLFVPYDGVYFTHGFQIGPGRRDGAWDTIDTELAYAVVDALPRLERLASLAGLLGDAQNWGLDVQQAELRLCIGLVADSDQLIDEARTALDEWQPDVPWESAVLDRCRDLVEVIENEGRDSAVDELELRRMHTQSQL